MKKITIHFVVKGPEGGILLESPDEGDAQAMVKWMKKEGYVVGEVLKLTILEEKVTGWE